MVRHAEMLMNVRPELIIVTKMPYVPINMDHLVFLVIPVMVSLALTTTNAQTEATIVLVMDNALIFQVHSAVHVELDTMEMDYPVLMLTNAMLEVTLVVLEMRPHVVMPPTMMIRSVALVRLVTRATVS